MTTSLYVPILDLKVNQKEGLKTIYESIVQSGPAYKLVVHDSPDWARIKDELPWPEMIEVIPWKKANEYANIAHRFLLPVASRFDIADKTIKDTEFPQYHIYCSLVMYRKFLARLLIAHDYKARLLNIGAPLGIFNMFDWPNREMIRPRKWHNQLEELEKHLSEDERDRLNFVEEMANTYKKDSIPTLAVNKDARIFNDLMDLLEKEEVKVLSQQNSKFSLVRVRKNILKRKVRILTNNIIQNEWFPYLTGGITLSLCYIASVNDIEKVLSFLTGVAAKALSKYDFREFAPAVQSADILELSRAHEASVTYSGFLEGTTTGFGF